jgi:hypothetical protein
LPLLPNNIGSRASALRVEAGEVVRREDFSLHDGKVELDLIKPTRVDWAMNERQAREQVLD